MNGDWEKGRKRTGGHLPQIPHAGSANGGPWILKSKHLIIDLSRQAAPNSSHDSGIVSAPLVIREQGGRKFQACIGLYDQVMGI